MQDTDVREQPSQTRGSLFDLTASKLLRPLVRPGTICRSSLLDGLASGDSRRIVSVVAPPGYGKTTLLAQWAKRTGPAFAWVSVDERDNDPKVLLTYVAEALDAVEPVGERVFDALASPGSSVPGSVVPRLGSAFASMTVPVVLVLDDVHLLHNQECRAALSVLAEHVPNGSRLVLAGRAEPPLRVARLRAEGRLAEPQAPVARMRPDGLELGGLVGLVEPDDRGRGHGPVRCLYQDMEVAAVRGRLPNARRRSVIPADHVVLQPGVAGVDLIPQIQDRDGSR
jgi:hypothetical protein